MHVAHVAQEEEEEQEEEDEDDEHIWRPVRDAADARSAAEEADSDVEVADALSDVSEPEPSSWLSRVWRALRGVKPDPTGVLQVLSSAASVGDAALHRSFVAPPSCGFQLRKTILESDTESS